MGLCLMLATTPQAGLPLRIARAVQKHTAHDARCILSRTGYGNRVFPTDLMWKPDDPRCQEVLSTFDIACLFGYFGPGRANPWHLDQHIKPHCKVSCHYGIQPKAANRSWPDELTSVSAQYHAREFPKAKILPNLMPIDDPHYKPRERQWPPDVPLRIAYSPSNRAGRAHMVKDPWAGKGYPETMAVLKRLVESHPGKVTLDVIENTPHETCMERRSQCHISIDEVLTGSYHNVHLEGMSQGLLSVVHMDEETRAAMGAAAIGGREAVDGGPWADATLETLYETLVAFVDGQGGLRERATACREWMTVNWPEKEFAEAYVSFWESLPPYLSVAGS